MPSALDLIDGATQRLIDAEVYFGHGTANAQDEATFLVLHALDLDYTSDDQQLTRELAEREIGAVTALITDRIERRLPSAYLTNRMWFAGLEFYVDERVLVPRSPLAELIETQFSPWLSAQSIEQVLEIGTGSGCIAIAMAHYLATAEIVATDISSDALEVAEKNLGAYPTLADRVRFILADCFPASHQRYDLIVSNPPYVANTIVDDLPREYLAEPAVALFSGADGLDIVSRILEQAVNHLNPGGALVLDVGDRWSLLEQRYPNTPFVWCELERGGEGIGIVSYEALGAVAESTLK